MTQHDFLLFSPVFAMFNNSVFCKSLNLIVVWTEKQCKSILLESPFTC